MTSTTEKSASTSTSADKEKNAPEKPDTTVTSPDGNTTYDTINAYSITVYLKSQQVSNPMGQSAQVVAASPDDASVMVQNFYGDDIINASSPVTALQRAFITAAPPPPAVKAKPDRPNRVLPPEADQHAAEKEHDKEQHGTGWKKK